MALSEGPRGPALKAKPAGDGKLNLVSGDGGGDDPSLMHHLLKIGGQLHVVTSQSGGERNAETGAKAPTLLVRARVSRRVASAAVRFGSVSPTSP